MASFTTQCLLTIVGCPHKQLGWAVLLFLYLQNTGMHRVFVPWSLPAGLFAAMNNLECVHPSDTYNRTTSAATSAGVCVSSSLSPCAVPVGCSWAFLVSLYRWKRSINRTATHCQVVLFQMQGFLLIVFTRKWTSCSHALPILFLITGWVQET